MLSSLFKTVPLRKLSGSFNMLTAALEQKEMTYPAVDLNTIYMRLNGT